MSSPLLIKYRPNSSATVRLFCMHCAGGSASEFRSWPAYLPDVEMLAIQLPGREGRSNEAFLVSMEELVGRVADAMGPWLDKPYVIFGHSLGALGGFEVIRELRRRGLDQPILFIPAGRQGPHLKEKRPSISALPEEAFIEELWKDYGNSVSAIFESADLRVAFIPQIRADFALFEAYCFRFEQPLGCPIVAFAGLEEDDLESHELNAWSAHTTRDFHSIRFPGDHFFLRDSQKAVLEAIRQEIKAVRLGRTVYAGT